MVKATNSEVASFADNIHSTFSTDRAQSNELNQEEKETKKKGTTLMNSTTRYPNRVG